MRLDKINNLPINPLLEQATSTLAQSEKTMQHVQTTLDNLNKIHLQPVNAAAARRYADDAA
ncbi:paraquat-inducible protein B [Klebsiella pneumoniae]|nr:paraquat-inducible protein B [Klebsiella pneumoniae]